MGARERGQCPRETRVGGLSRALPRAFSNERMRHFWGPFHGLAARKAANAEEAALVDTDETRETAVCGRYVSNGRHCAAWAGRNLSALFGGDNES